MGNQASGQKARTGRSRPSQDRFRSIADQSLAAVLILDPGLRVVYANEEAGRITSFAPEELIGRDLSGWVHPGSVADVKNQSARLRSAADAPSRFEFSIVRKDGQGRLAECLPAVLPGPKGRPDIVMQFADITERRGAEEELEDSNAISKVVFDYAPDWIYLTDLNGFLIDGNFMAERLTGYSKEELVGMNLLTSGLLPAGEVPKAARLLTFNYVGKPSGPDELIFRRKDGTLVPMEIRSFPVKANGKTMILGIARDITVRKQAEEDLLKSREDLETLVRERTRELESAKQAADAANSAKSTFLAHMSHEIRTPINAIMGFSQLMQRDDTLASHQRQHLNVINRSGEHLLALITDVLEMSKIEAGRTTLNPTTFSLLSLLEDLELMFRMRAEAKNLTFALEVPGQIPRYVEGDEGKLRQILINLLGNAVKFTAAGRIVLRIRAGRKDAGGIRLEAEVEDTGPGISEEEQKDLFKPFQQARSGRLMRSGTGLGLAICKEFVTLMGGEITVSSRAGKGSLFKFRIDLGEGDAGFVEKRPGSQRVKCLRSGQATRRILIADDEEFNGTFLANLLGDIGFETKRVTSGKEALDVFRTWRPHLVLMDLRMPEMDGCEAMRRLRASEGGTEVRIVGVSASAFEEDRREALAAGADDFLTKPFREEVLFEKIGRLLEVEFELAEETPSGTAPGRGVEARGLTTDALAVLPGGFARGMRDAVVKADYDRMIGLIDGIAGRDEPVARELRGLVERYEYNALLNLLPMERSDR